MTVEAIQLRKPFDILRNGSLSTQPYEALLQHGIAVAGLLQALGGKHTFHPTPEALAFAMQKKHAILATDTDGLVAGFVKAVPWLTTPKGPKMFESPEDVVLVESGGAKPICVEVGSLVVEKDNQGNNLGSHLGNLSAQHAKEVYPGLPVIAVVTNDNTASLHVFGKKLNWPEIQRDYAQELLGIDVLDGWEPPSTIFLCP